MKKITFIIVSSITIISLGTFSACMSSDQKNKVAEDKVLVAEEKLQEAQENAYEVADQTATDDELKAFKLESELQIRKNDVSIAELRLKMNNSDKKNDKIYAERIDTLVKRNENLNARIYNYQKTQRDWNKFKREFKNDMDNLGQAIKDLGVNNKK